MSISDETWAARVDRLTPEQREEIAAEFEAHQRWEDEHPGELPVMMSLGPHSPIWRYLIHPEGSKSRGGLLRRIFKRRAKG